MPPVAVWMANIVYLEAEGVLEVVARLLLGESRHDRRSLRDVHDHEPAGVRQSASHFLYPGLRRYLVRALAEVELSKWADVAQFTDAVVAVVVRQTMRVRHGTRGLAEQRLAAGEG